MPKPIPSRRMPAAHAQSPRVSGVVRGGAIAGLHHNRLDKTPRNPELLRQLQSQIVHTPLSK